MPKYSKEAQESVRKAVKAYEQGKLFSGKSGKPVTNRLQAVAIGLSEARKEGAKMPPYKRK